MNLRNIVNKVVGVTLGVLTVDSWIIAKAGENRVKADSKLQEQLELLKKANIDKDIADQNLKTELVARTGRASEAQIEIEKLSKESSEIIKKINKGDLASENKDQLFQDLNRKLERKNELVSKVTDEVKNLNDKFVKSDLSGFIQDIIDSYKEFLSNLSVEQLGCLANGIAFSIIISAVNTLALTHYGNKIISYFNLESKFTKLGKFIQIRSKLSDKFIKFQIVYIYLTSIVMLVINIYMFFS